ncbi:hypothetical protein EUX98_g7614, partial [Antrodiella citrinella]
MNTVFTAPDDCASCADLTMELCALKKYCASRDERVVSLHTSTKQLQQLIDAERCQSIELQNSIEKQWANLEAVQHTQLKIQALEGEFVARSKESQGLLARCEKAEALFKQTIKQKYDLENKLHEAQGQIQASERKFDFQFKESQVSLARAQTSEALFKQTMKDKYDLETKSHETQVQMQAFERKYLDQWKLAQSLINRCTKLEAFVKQTAKDKESREDSLRRSISGALTRLGLQDEFHFEAIGNSFNLKRKRSDDGSSETHNVGQSAPTEQKRIRVAQDAFTQLDASHVKMVDNAQVLHRRCEEAERRREEAEIILKQTMKDKDCLEIARETCIEANVLSIKNSLLEHDVEVLLRRCKEAETVKDKDSLEDKYRLEASLEEAKQFNAGLQASLAKQARLDRSEAHAKSCDYKFEEQWIMSQTLLVSCENSDALIAHMSEDQDRLTMEKDRLEVTIRQASQALRIVGIQDEDGLMIGNMNLKRKRSDVVESDSAKTHDVSQSAQTEIYGLSLTLLNGGPNALQKEALDEMCVDMGTLEKRFNLDVPTRTYAVCQRCSHTYESTYPDGAEVEDDGTPIETFEYHPFFDWFGRFIAQPGIEQYGDSFCNAVDNVPEGADDRNHTWDGDFYQHIKDPDGKLFVADRGAEGRWFFVFSADFFNVEGNKIGGKHASTGVISMVCLNLPLGIRNDPAHTYIAGIIQGPDEPNAKKAEHCQYLRPLLADMEVGYTRGVQVFASSLDQANGIKHYERTHRVAFAAGVMDFKAARPFSGLLDVGSHWFCYTCSLWNKSHLWRTNYKDWGKVDDVLLKEGAAKWRSAVTRTERQKVQADYGTRDSGFWILPYFLPSLQILEDPMHTLQRVERCLFVDALRLANAFNKDKDKQDKKDKKDKKVLIAHYYDFTLPPSPLSIKNCVSSPDNNEDPFAVLQWSHLREDVAAQRESLLLKLKDRISDVNEPGSPDDLLDLRFQLSVKHPVGDRLNAFSKKILTFTWYILVYICIDLMLLPDTTFEACAARGIPAKSDITKEAMARALVNWRTAGILDVDAFVWPHFTPMNTDRPGAPWARPPPLMHADGLSYSMSTEDRQNAMLNMLGKLNSRACADIGRAHRYLYAPVTKKLGSKLKKCSENSLLYVCYDVNRVPLEPGKDACVAQLVTWRASQNPKILPWTPIDSAGVLGRLHVAIRDAVVPSWVTKLSQDFGLPSAGTPKADNWRTLYMLYMPLALLSLWDEGSPIAADNAQQMSSVLETSMYLSGASTIMMQKTLTRKDRDEYREFLGLHIRGLNSNFPGVLVPSHHLAFHIYDNIEHFSGVRNASCFASERLIGKLRRIPINHKTGQFEGTLLHSFNKAALFRRWLLRPDCPPLLKICRDLLDKAYDFSHETSGDMMALEDDGGNIVQHTRVPGVKGFYTTTRAEVPGEGNANICFRPAGRVDEEWVPAKIEKIEGRNGNIFYTVRRWIPRPPDSPQNDYKRFWCLRMEAKLVSADLSNTPESIEHGWIVSHIALWKLTPQVAVVFRMPECHFDYLNPFIQAALFVLMGDTSDSMEDDLKRAYDNLQREEDIFLKKKAMIRDQEDTINKLTQRILFFKRSGSGARDVYAALKLQEARMEAGLKSVQGCIEEEGAQSHYLVDAERRIKEAE